MRELIQRIIFQLLVEGLRRLIVFTFLPIDPPEIVVGILVVGIDLDLLLKRCDGLIILASREIDEPEIVPGKFIFRIDFGGAFEATSTTVAACFCRLAEILPHGVLGLLQHYRHL